MYYHQRILPSTFSTWKTEKRWGQQWIMVWFQEDWAQKHADMLYSLPLWTRWTMNRAQGKPFELYQKQESRLTRILGKHIKTRYIGTISCSHKKDDCNLTKQGPMRSSSMTHYLQSSLRKRFVWKLKNCFTKEKAQNHVFFSEQIRNVDHKIYPEKKQDHLGKHKAMHRNCGKPGAKWWITEFQAYPSQHSFQVDREVRITSAQRTISYRYESDGEDQPIQWSIAKIAARFGPGRDLRTLWEFNKIPMFRLQLLHRNRNNLLQLWTKFEDFAQSHNISTRKLRFQLDLWLHH